MAERPFGPVGIIDIGSNSVRLVAYGGSERVPSMLFNEKVMAGLGRGLAETGRLSEPAMALALEALARFRLLAREMKLKKLHAVATAAVRDATNGPEFLERAAAAGITPELIPGEEEARLSALGVISAIPHARGVVADLGGGSLELTPVADGAPSPGVSLPLGVLRVGEQASAKALAATVRKGVTPELLGAARDGNLYLVGGSFRAFAQLDLLLADHPLPIVHQHSMDPARVRDLRNLVRATSTDDLRNRVGLQSGRLQTLPAAAAILDALCRVLGARRVVTSAFGLREGILYDNLSAERRSEDPLLAAALEVGERLGRFGDHGALLDRWIAPLFPDDTPLARRLRRAACLLADVAWNAHPDFRAEWAVDMGLHGNWVGIDAEGRAILGRTLCSAFGGDGAYDDEVGALVEARVLEHAGYWGRAIRLAQRLSGGTASLLKRTTVEQDGERLLLRMKKRDSGLYSDTVRKRHKQLSAALKLRAELALD
ncbi:Ppx/GppA family phosphatase [Sphingomonas sp. BN140010]|uniref:Ppx/GppA family phosphatase n=1 Tax=Sphingomonas arvum TaxID=2992113 RepID=A0ABT3JI08_9SPHN|nr:Ppx/GppA family phosphatase [Sphingomonas sp. BN140010]MCW3798687.1 Ppx/GppA family phosphatase [Sphingomonas sp. BN140010]